MATSRGQGGIQQLLAAEQEAQHILNAARNAKLARQKQAKVEAENEISEYRAQVESEFQKKLSESSGDSGANVKRLEQETETKIHYLKEESARISHDVWKSHTASRQIRVLGSSDSVWRMKKSRMAPPPLVSASDLPNEIIFIILQNLPAKSLFKFMFVSRTWRSMITSRIFVLSYKGPQRNLYFHDSLQYRAFLEGAFAAVDDWVMPSIFKSNSFIRSLESSCNGLILLVYRTGLKFKLCLWNPNIRKQKILPATSSQNSQKFRIFQNSRSECRPIFTFGLGFDSTTNDYKVVRIEFCQKSPSMPRVEIYSLSTNSWRNLEFPNRSNYIFQLLPSSTSAYVDGVFYWYGICIDENKRVNRSILMFDFSEARFREVKMPDDLNGFNVNSLRIAVFKGLLTLVFDNDNDGKTSFIWKMMKEIFWMREEVKCSEIKPLVRDTLIFKKCFRSYLDYPHTACEEEQLQCQYIYATTETLVLL